MGPVLQIPISYNTRIGTLIDSAALAQAVGTDFEGAPENAWSVRLDKRGELI